MRLDPGAMCCFPDQEQLLVTLNVLFPLFVPAEHPGWVPENWRYTLLFSDIYYQPRIGTQTMASIYSAGVLRHWSSWFIAVTGAYTEDSSYYADQA